MGYVIANKSIPMQVVHHVLLAKLVYINWY